MPILYLDVSRLVNRSLARQLPTGVDRVGLAYVRHYRLRAAAVLSYRGRYVVLSAARSVQLFELLLQQPSASARKAILNTLVLSLMAAPWVKQRPGVLLHTAHSGIEYERYFAALARHGIGVVAMIHDLIPLTHPEYCRPGVLDLQTRRMRVGLASVRGVIANSDDTARSIATFMPKLGESRPPMVTALLAPGAALCYPGDRPLPEPYFVILSTIEPRKNHWLLLHVWRELVERLGDQCPRLVVIGRRGWECENVVDMLERCEALKGKVIEESECSDERLHLYLQHAQALLFPSFVEGYGMPMVEAMQLGVPVLASDLEVFHEVAGEIPDYIDPLDGTGWQKRIIEYSLPMSTVRNAQLRRLDGYSPPSWEQHFQIVDQFVDGLAGE